MRKSVFQFFVLSQITIHCLAQQPIQKFTAEVLLGPSLPCGKFSDKSANPQNVDKASGWAMPGPALQIAGKYYFNKVYGVSLLAGWQENKQDAGAVTNNVKQGQPDSLSFKTTSKSWKTWKILAGGFLKIPISRGNKFYFQSSLMAGVLKTSVPGYSFLYYNSFNGSPNLLGGGAFSGRSLPLSFCYQAEAGVQWQFTQRVFFSSGINYFHSAPAWKYTYYPLLFPPSNNGTARETKYPVSGINIMFGIGASF
jgi:hypothetical protein